MAVSSNYKSYNRQVRALTEETGFAGGMLWTGNNIPETYLKNIVNFDYDDTTGFLKTRKPFITEQAIHAVKDQPIELDSTKGVELLGVYNICAYDESQDVYGDAGWLYWFGQCSERTDDNIVSCSSDTFQIYFKDKSGNWFDVDYVYEGEDESAPEPHITELCSLNKVQPILYDNTLYCTTLETTQPCAVFRLTYENTAGDDEDSTLFRYHNYTLEQYNQEKVLEYIDSVTLLEATSTGFNGARGLDMYTYQSTTTPDPDAVKAITGVYLTDSDGNLVISPRLGQSVTCNIILDNIINTPQTTPSYINVFELKQNKNTSDESAWKHIHTCTVTETGASFEHVFSNEATSFAFVWSPGQYAFQINREADNPFKLLEDDLKGAFAIALKDTKNLAEGQVVSFTLSKTYEKVGIIIKVYDNSGIVIALNDVDNFKLDESDTKENLTDASLLWVPDDRTLGDVCLGTPIDAEQASVTEPTAYTSLIPVSWSTNKTSTSSKLKPYDLPSAKAQCLWKHHLVLWDVVNQNNALFISEVDNFYYFPVPNNVVLFETDIISCIPYLGDLLVFTSDKIYRLSENTDGSFVQEVVQNDMPLLRADAPHLRAIKNMVLFKSGKYFYMVVPKTQSLTGELTIAPIYKNIAGFLNNITAGVSETLSILYPEYKYETLEVCEDPFDIYVEQDTIRILYNINATHSFKGGQLTTDVDGNVIEDLDNLRIGPHNQAFVLFLNYNTNFRAWTTYLEDATDLSLYPATLTAARNMSFVRIDTSYGYPQLCTASQQDSTDMRNAFRCVIDTGYRTLIDSIKKRFREVQFKLYSGTENTTAFGTAFYVDGCVRRSYKKFTEVFTDEQCDTVILLPEYDVNTLIAEDGLALTTAGELVTDTAYKGSDQIELSDWSLDFSHFKRNAPVTVRVPVSGKGYSPRFIIHTTQGLSLCINKINWVYRTMYGR